MKPPLDKVTTITVFHQAFADTAQKHDEVKGIFKMFLFLNLIIMTIGLKSALKWNRLTVKHHESKKMVLIIFFFFQMNAQVGVFKAFCLFLLFSTSFFFKLHQINMI